MPFAIYKKAVLIFITFFITAFAQNKNFLQAKQDTSYTIYSATKKIRKKFPNAKPVIAYLSKNVSEEKNIVYKNTGTIDLHLDLFYPKLSDEQKCPAVVLIHGGGWRTGNRELVVPMAQKLAAQGFVTAAIQYRLSTEAFYPAAVYDIKSAIKWIKINADSYNIDTNKIAVYGASAGGQLAALVGTTNHNPAFENDTSAVSAVVQAVINIDGVVDFFGKGSEEVVKKSGKLSAAHLWFGLSAKENKNLWEEAGAVNHVDENTPPFLFINSAVPRFHAGQEEMIKKLNHFNIIYEVHTIENTAHTFWLFEPWFNITFNYTLNFLNKIFKN